MFTIYTLATPLDGAVLVGFVCLLAFAIYALHHWRHNKPPQKKKKQQSKGGRDSIQAGKNISIHQGSHELQYFMQCKDLQNTVNECFTQMRAKDELKQRIMDQMDTKNQVILAGQEQIKKLEADLCQLRQENDALWDENNRLKYEQLANRFPVIEMKPKKEEKPKKAKKEEKKDVA